MGRIEPKQILSTERQAGVYYIWKMISAKCNKNVQKWDMGMANLFLTGMMQQSDFSGELFWKS